MELAKYSIRAVPYATEKHQSISEVDSNRPTVMKTILKTAIAKDIDSEETIDMAERIIEKWESPGRHPSYSKMDFDSDSEDMYEESVKDMDFDLKEIELARKPSHSELENNFEKDRNKGVMEWWESNFYADGIESEELEYDIQPPPVVKSVLGRNSAVQHLQDIAKLQLNIMTLLKKIQQQSKGNKKCSAKNLKEQQEAIADMQTALDMKVPQLSEEPR